MADRLLNFFNDSQALMSHCPVCNSKFNPLEAKVLEERENSYLIHVKCQHCDSFILAIIVAGAMGISSIGLLTDLSAEDVSKFKKHLPISWDDVIEAHQQLTQEKAIINQFK